MDRSNKYSRCGAVLAPPLSNVSGKNSAAIPGLGFPSLEAPCPFQFRSDPSIANQERCPYRTACCTDLCTAVLPGQRARRRSHCMLWPSSSGPPIDPCVVWCLKCSGTGTTARLCLLATILLMDTAGTLMGLLPTDGPPVSGPVLADRLPLAARTRRGRRTGRCLSSDVGAPPPKRRGFSAPPLTRDARNPDARLERRDCAAFSVAMTPTSTHREHIAPSPRVGCARPPGAILLPYQTTTQTVDG